MNNVSIFNPIGSAIIALGGTEQDYNDFSFITGVALGATATYKQYYEIYKPYYETYAASRMYGNQVNNVENTSKQIVKTIYTDQQDSKYYDMKEASSNYLYSTTKLNEAGAKLLIQTPNGVGVVQVTPKGYIEAYGRVNGKGVYYSSSPVSSATKSLLQIGNTTGYDLASRINGTPQKLLTANYETYYRTISQEHYDILKSTGKIPAGYNGETFISPSLSYVQRYDYGGVTLEFKLNPGTMNELMNIGVKSKNQNKWHNGES